MKVCRTVFEVSGGTAVLVIKVSAVTAPVTLLLPPSKTQISTQCVALCYVSFYCPISISVSSPAIPPAPCWMEHSGDSVPSWGWGGGACKDTLTPARTSWNSFMPLNSFPNSSNIPFLWGKGSSQLQGLVASHQCPCFISSDCISLTFYLVCSLHTNFWGAQGWAWHFWPPPPCCAHWHDQHIPPFQWMLGSAA